MSDTFWVFPVSAELAQDIRQLAVELDGGLSGGAVSDIRNRFVRTLNVSIDAGFHFYYTVPMEYSRSVGTLVRKTVDSIISAARHGIHLVIQQVFKGLSVRDLQSMAWYLDSMVVPAHSQDKALLAFPLKADLVKRLDNLMESIRASDQVATYSRELYGVFSDIIDASVYYYYQKPTNEIHLNRLAKKAADLGIHSTVKGIKSVIKHVLKDVSHEEALALPDNMHFLLAERNLNYLVGEARFIAEKG